MTHLRHRPFHEQAGPVRTAVVAGGRWRTALAARAASLSGLVTSFGTRLLDRVAPNDDRWDSSLLRRPATPR